MSPSSRVVGKELGSKHMTDIPSEGNLVIPVEKVPVAAFEAIYQHITRKIETLNKSYKGDFKLTFRNLEELYRQIEQSVAQYQIKAKKCEVSFTLSNGEVHTYSTFEKFASMNYNAITHRIRNISISYDFLVIPPPTDLQLEELSQRYKIRVDYTQEMEESEHIIISGGIFLREITLGSAPVLTHIEYSDYAVARHVQSLLDDWVERLRFSDERVLGKKTLKWTRRIATAAVFALVIAAFIGSVFFEPGSYASYVTPMRYFAMVLAVAITALIVGIYLDTQVTKLTGLLTAKTTIQITHGDKEAMNKLLDSRKKSYTSLYFVFSAIIVAMIVSLAANYLTSMLLEGK